MKKVGIMGGTFDPVHMGHLRMAEAAFEQEGLDEVRFMPSGTPAYKLEEHRVSDKADRAEMTRLALKGKKGFSVSLMECEREGNTYTADTLEILTEAEPESIFYFIMGADSLNYLDQWRKPETIMRLARIIAVGRRGFSRENLERKACELKKRFGAVITFVEMEPVDISSTEIRERVKNGLPVTGLVPEETEQYIREHHLYGA